VQVFKRLDSSTLCTSVPLVCQHWKAAAASDQIWAPRCDPQLLAVLNQQHPTAHAAGSDPNPAAGAASTPALSSTQGSHASCRQALQPCQHSRSCRTTPGPCHRVPLPLLHHAVYSFNLLRNPEFLAAANADYSASLQQCLARLAAVGSSQKPAMVTSEQRKFAWVRAVLRLWTRVLKGGADGLWGAGGGGGGESTPLCSRANGKWGLTLGASVCCATHAWDGVSGWSRKSCPG
jgi:hypothetical protein